MSTVAERMLTSVEIMVPSRKLSHFIHSDVSLLKLDVEGAENAILYDLMESGTIDRIRRIHLEYHHHIDRGRDELSHTLRVLENHGFGYQIRAGQGLWPSECSFQDISIYCYRKSAA
jgi:hypothetical protein